jgi:tetratricopeptide (TPR) repeat protein
MTSRKPVTLTPKQYEIIQKATALQQSGQLAAATAQYKKLLTALPNHTTLLNNLGTLAIQQRLFAEGIKYLDRSLQIDPRQAPILNNRAAALAELKHWEQAISNYDRAIALNPQFAPAYNNRGGLLLAMQQPEAALADFNQAISLQPNFVDALSNRGAVLKELQRHTEALLSCDQAIVFNPNFAKAHANRGNVLKNLNRLNEALACYDRAIALNPQVAEFFYNRANTLAELHQAEQALASYNQAIALNPTYSEAWCNQGIVLKRLNRLNAALDSYQQAITLNPNFVEAHTNRGNALRELKRLDEALISHDRAIAINPDYAPAQFNKSLLLLLIGDYAQGWPLYEWGWKSRERTPARNFLQPLWLGEQPLSDKTLLIHLEQGLGDYIQFIRYALLAEQQAGQVILEVPAPLLSLMSSLKGSFTLIKEGQPLPEFDYHCPLMSLPLAFHTQLQTIPAQTPYLQADPAKQQDWLQQLGEKTKPRIGITCTGSMQQLNDHNRSSSFRHFAPLFELPLEFHCLQKEIRPDDAQFIAEQGNIITHHQQLQDFSDTAALLATMDLVISVDTSIAHLAGALAKPVWVLLAYVPDHRWLMDRTDNPWYPSATLFRQTATADWAGVMMEVKERLSTL